MVSRKLENLYIFKKLEKTIYFSKNWKEKLYIFKRIVNLYGFKRLEKTILFLKYSLDHNIAPACGSSKILSIRIWFQENWKGLYLVVSISITVNAIKQKVSFIVETAE